MTYVLGISGINSENPAAALVKDGNLLAAVEEERFNRVKHSKGFPFPEKSIKYCLDYAGITLSEVESIGVGWGSPLQHFKKELFLALKRPVLLPNYRNWTSVYKKEKQYSFFKDNRISYHLHHISHASSAFHLSGFKDTNIITMDGRGEASSTLLGKGTDSRDIEVIKEFNLLNSIGALYESFTDYLGFTRHSHEGKVMGLASYGIPLETRNLVKIKENGYSLETPQRYLFMLKGLKRKLIGKKAESFNELLKSNYGKPRKKDEPISKTHQNIAATVQFIQEAVVRHLAEILYNKTGIKNLCLAGGSSLNCVSNGKLLENEFVEDIFVQPASSDSGTAIGAAYLEWIKIANKPSSFKMEHAYYGPEFSNEEIEKVLKENKLKYQYFKDISGEVAELLNKGKIVGWFQGRMEVGPRALGNRSILANPTIKDMKDKVNRQVKHRESWRPFCPSLLDEVRKKYLEMDYPSPFMILSFKVKEELWNEIPSVVHVDGTARPQTVERKYNKRYYDLIKSFGKLTGHPIILNTSFNDKEEPLVCSPKDAINCLKRTNLDYLAMGNYLVKG